jgi:hypothetical protein
MTVCLPTVDMDLEMARAEESPQEVDHPHLWGTDADHAETTSPLVVRQEDANLLLVIRDVMTAEAPTQGLTTDSRVQNLESSLNEAWLDLSFKQSQWLN